MVGIGQTDYRTAKGYIPEIAVWFSMVYIRESNHCTDSVPNSIYAIDTE